MLGKKALPGMAPCAADDWLRVDEAYGRQMAYRARLLAERPAAVLWQEEAALDLLLFLLLLTHSKAAAFVHSCITFYLGMCAMAGWMRRA